MNKAILLIFLFTSYISYSKPKTVHIQNDRGVVYKYDTDSSCLEKKDNIKFIRTFHAFYKSIYTNDTATYFSLLSPLTIERIESDKLKKKFSRYHSYIPMLTGVLILEWIKIIPEKLIETEQIYMCILKLPGDTKAVNRVGFDPAKRFKPKDESYIGLMIVKLENEFKVVIPW